MFPKSVHTINVENEFILIYGTLRSEHVSFLALRCSRTRLLSHPRSEIACKVHVGQCVSRCSHSLLTLLHLFDFFLDLRINYMILASASLTHSRKDLRLSINHGIPTTITRVNNAIKIIGFLNMDVSETTSISHITQHHSPDLQLVLC